MHALIGPNGAGKSTCLNVLTGVYAAERGRASATASDELTRLRPHRIAALGVARTFQNLALSPRRLGRWTTCCSAATASCAAGFVADGLRLPRARRERAEHEARVREIAELLGLDRRSSARSATLPYGDAQARRAGAGAVRRARRCCCSTSPSPGMDPDESRGDGARRSRRPAPSSGISVVLVEHDMAFVMGMADRVTVLDFGKRIADGTPGEVQRDPEVLARLPRQRGERP